jgi:hypothetical protein
MSFSARYIATVLFALLSLAASVSAQSTPRQTSKTPQGSISGRVTIKEKGVAGVAIGIRKSDVQMMFEPFQKAVTDQDGYYRVNNIAPGGYEIAPSAPAFVMVDSKDRRSKSVQLGEGENVEGINFAMVRGGVITGRVTDADGRPLIQQQVNLYRIEAPDPQSPPRPAFTNATAQTDDRGIYRVFGLAAGRYKVSSGRGEDTFSMPYGAGRATYNQVFYPDATDQTKATIIEVSEGGEATNIDISLGRAVQTFVVTGRVVDNENGLAIPNVRFIFQRVLAQRVEYVNDIVTSNVQGDFMVEGLIPGKYSVNLLPSPSSDMRVEPLSFDVIDQDVSGVMVRLMKGASLTGNVVLESEDKAAFAQLQQFQLRAFVRSPAGVAGGMGSSAMSQIAPDGSFRLSGLPGGTVNIMLGSSMSPIAPKGFSIARVERDGIVAPRGIEIKDGEQLTGVRVVISYGKGILRGVVKLENGSLPEGGRIFLGLMRVGDSSPNTRIPPQVDARGHFLIDGLAPGTYEVSVSIVLATPGRSARALKQEVAIQDGQTTEVTLVVDMSAVPKP